MAGKFVLTKTTNGKFRFNLKAGNGQVILTSQTYDTRANAKKGIESVRKNSAKDDRFERKAAKDGRPYFTLKSVNAQVIGQSQMYSSNSTMENGIKSVRNYAADATVDDQTVA